MSYTVLWVRKAEEELAALWLNAADPDVVTAAANEIDARLRVEPQRQGESRPQGRRILLVPPLGVIFVVVPDDRIVRVLHVWRFQAHE